MVESKDTAPTSGLHLGRAWQILITGCVLAGCSSSGTASLGVIVAHSDNSSASCQSVPLDERLRVLSTLNDDQVSCPNGDDSCPCGAYCNGLTGLCEVDCIAGVVDLPDSIPGCNSHQQCTPLGRCEASSTTPPPPVQALTLQISPPVISGNPASAPVLVPVAITVTANSLDFVRPDHPAVVRYQFQTAPGETPPAGPMPQVKCAADAALADHCDVAGWTFHADTGILVSDPRTLWVQLPQTATAAQWTLEGRSAWALTPATAVVSAEPVAFPATDPGHYAGTLTWTHDGGAAGVSQLSVPVEAIVTSSHVALYERSRILLPDGHAVISRDPAKVALLGWLGSGAARYDVKLGLAVGPYRAATGHLDAAGTFQTGSLRQTAFSLSLQRTGDAGVASCSTSSSCATGSYCDAVMSLCLPGSGPAAGAGIVSATGAAPSATLASSLVTAWSAPLTSLLNSSALLSGATPREQFERPYCFQASNQGGPAGFARGATIQLPSADLRCNVGAAEMPQLTFPFENLQQEVGQDSNGNAFNLLDQCVSDLDTPPTASVPAVNKCASLSRFLLALRPPQPDDLGVRLKTQLLRQWLGVNAYVASTAVSSQQYEDVLGVTGQPPPVRLVAAMDRVERGLGLLLDPSARPTYAPDGGIATQVAAAPDYRFLRPSLRLSFNESTATYTNAETGGTIGPCTRPLFNTAGAWTPTQNIFGPPDPSDFPCQINSTGTFGSPAGFSITLAFDKTANKPSGGPFSQDGVVQISDPSGATRLTIQAQYANINNSSQVVALSLWESVNGTTVAGVSFPNIERPLWDTSGVGFGVLALIKRGSTYSLIQARPNQPVQVFPGTGFGLEVPFVVPSGNLALGGASETIDELALWNRPLSPEEVAGMGAQYFAGFNGHVVLTNPTLPVRPNPLPGNDQAAGLPVHLLEAANADLNLVQAYVTAETGTVYTQCLAGARGELDTVSGRVGQSLRLIAVLADEAAAVVAATGTSTAWAPRYQADLTELAGRRAALISSLALLQTPECKNPLGIAEEDLPLYVGSAGPSAAERFFAGSRFLATAALSEIAVAGGETGSDGLLAQARVAYNAARTSQFQEAQGAHDSADRILKISTDYEAQLKRYCGTPPGEDVAHGIFPLLAGFQSGALDATNCFLKSELAECRGLAATPLSQVPAHCLRGEIGERLLAIQAAAVDADNANNGYNRAVAQFDSDMQYCGRLQKELAGNEDLLRTHTEHMVELRRERASWGIVFGIVAGIRGAVVTAASGGKAPGGGGGIQDVAGLFQAFKERDLDEGIQAEQDAYEQEKLERLDRQEIQACVQKADNEKFAIDAARRADQGRDVRARGRSRHGRRAGRRGRGTARARGHHRPDAAAPPLLARSVDQLVPRPHGLRAAADLPGRARLRVRVAAVERAPGQRAVRAAAQ